MNNNLQIEELFNFYNNYIYNICIRLVYNKQDAEDLTQDVWLKITNSLDSFRQESDIKTWMYKIAYNAFLDNCQKYQKLEFDKFASTMDAIENSDIEQHYESQLAAVITEEAKVGCLLGMLLCLDYEQRIIFVLSEIFEIKGEILAEILNISHDSLRQKNKRAKDDLYNFMNNNCSLVNQSNSCKCSKKAYGLIKAGYISDISNINKQNLKQIYKMLKPKSNKLDTELEIIFANLYKNHPFYELNDDEFAKKILQNRKIIEIFSL